MHFLWKVCQKWKNKLWYESYSFCFPNRKQTVCFVCIPSTTIRSTLIWRLVGRHLSRWSPCVAQDTITHTHTAKSDLLSMRPWCHLSPVTAVKLSSFLFSFVAQPHLDEKSQRSGEAQPHPTPDQSLHNEGTAERSGSESYTNGHNGSTVREETIRKSDKQFVQRPQRPLGCIISPLVALNILLQLHVNTLILQPPATWTSQPQDTHNILQDKKEIKIMRKCTKWVKWLSHRLNSHSGICLSSPQPPESAEQPLKRANWSWTK